MGNEASQSLSLPPHPPLIHLPWQSGRVGGDPYNAKRPAAPSLVLANKLFMGVT